MRSIRNVFRAKIFLPAMLLFLFPLVRSGPSGLTAQGVDEDLSTPEPDEQQKQLIDVLYQLQTLYMDVYPLYRKLKQMRSVNESASRREQVRNSIREQTGDRLRSISDQLDRINPTNEKVKESLQKVREEVYQNFVKFLERFLSEWSPENPERVAKMSLNEKINNDVAGPSLLRRVFLVRLAKHLRRLPTPEDQISKRIERLEKQLDPLYWSVLEKFNELVERVHEAREKAAEKEGDGETDEEEGDGDQEQANAGAEAEGSQDESEDSDDEPLPVVRKANREWKEFVRRKRNEQDTDLEEMNRILSLFRGRDYLYPDEKEQRRKVLSIKRRMGQLRKLQNREGLFSSKEKIRKALLSHGKVLLQSYTGFLQGANWPSDAFQRLSELPELNNLNRERYEAKVSSIQYEKERWGRFKKDTYADLRNQCETISKHTEPVAEHLKRFGEKEKKVGELVSELQRIASDALKRLKKDSLAMRKYHNTFISMSFSSARKFKKQFAARMKKLQKRIYGTTEDVPEPTGQQLEQQLKDLGDRVKRHLDLDQ